MYPRTRKDPHCEIGRRTEITIAPCSKILQNVNGYLMCATKFGDRIQQITKNLDEEGTVTSMCYCGTRFG